MSVQAAYVAVLLIWSTTPLGLAWSAESLGSALAGLGRMALALPLALLLMRAMGLRLPWHRKAVHSYLASVVMLFGAMYSGYVASQYIPSGLLSLIWGLSPLLSGLVAIPLLGERSMTPARLVALLIALAGLAVVMADDLVLGEEGIFGVTLVLCAVSIYSVSNVLVKKIDAGIHPLAQTTGALLFAQPLYLIAFWLEGGEIPQVALDDRGLWAMIYLAVFGSIIGFLSFFYLLKRLSATTLNLVTLVCPVFALALGNLVNQELLSFNLLAGALLVISGLACYFWGDRVFRRLSGGRQPAAVDPVSK
ncbi:DMT family transporter [Marinobacterium jannaschii]|uniref:DMT family transporter n=1 Tax=Marinobacterium jannaschii TaxID=64970 RepID=UPI00056D21E0|nr:DMT family transporter [Marinobacterium jannaschii]